MKPTNKPTKPIKKPIEDNLSLSPKAERLISGLREMQSAVLAYSGGLDSTLLLMALKLSGVRALAVTSSSPTTPEHDLADALAMAAEIGVEHRVVRTCEMDKPAFTSNTPERCYHCKDELFGVLTAIARDEGYAYVLDGTNHDDLSDHRPGMKAAREHGVRSPLLEAGLGKDEIRDASRALGLATWSKPSSACLSSRVPYGTEITPEVLLRVSGAERLIRKMGFAAIRVRDHWPVARIEIAQADYDALLVRKDEVSAGLRAIGYKFVCLDLEPLSSGSMNKMVGDEQDGRR